MGSKNALSEEMLMSPVINSLQRWQGLHLPLGLLSLSLSLSLLLSLASPAVCSDINSSGSEGARDKRQSGPPYCALAEGICEEIEDYPEEAVLRAEIDCYSEFFSSDYLDKSSGSRSDSGSTMCDSIKKIVYPKMAQNSRGEWLYIVNQQNGNMRQGVSVEICKKPYESCEYGDSFPGGLTTECKQKFAYRRLVAVSLDGKTIEPDDFKVPSCCSCFVKNG